MKTNVESLKALYLKLGGALTDTYTDIAGGIPVGEYDLISDCILACAKKGGGGVTIDENPTEGSENAVSSGGVYTALSGKQATLTFDDAPTEDSANPVKSGGVYSALSGKANTADMPLIVDGDLNGAGTAVDITASGVTLAQIYNAAVAGRMVVLQFTLGDLAYRLGLSSYELDDGEYNLSFSAAAEYVKGSANLLVDFNNTLIGAFKIVIGPMILHGTVSGSSVTITDDASLELIYNAAEAGRYVAIEFSLDGNTLRIPLASRAEAGDTYTFTFACAAISSSKPSTLGVTFTNSKTGTFTQAVVS